MKSKILLIDDDTFVHFINKRLLNGEFPEGDTHFFYSALLALDWLNANEEENCQYTILLDINMPEIDGWQFIDLLQKDFSMHKFQIHMLSASLDQSDQIQAQNHKFVNSYILKPLCKSKIRQVLCPVSQNIAAE